MHIILNHSSMVPIYEQLMEQIKSDIINSSLKEGEALPSVRSLAGELRISALTVKKAYDKLEGGRVCYNNSRKRNVCNGLRQTARAGSEAERSGGGL